MKEAYKSRKVFVIILLMLAHGLFNTLIGAEEDLPRCIDARDVPERVTIAHINFFEVLYPDQEYLSAVSMELFNREQSLNNDTIVSVECLKKFNPDSTNLEGPDSGKFAMQASLEVFGNQTLREDRNLVAVSGGQSAYMSEALDLVSQTYGYPHIDTADTMRFDNKARFPMFVRIRVPNYMASQVYIELLGKFDVCKTIVLSSVSNLDASHDFIQRANEAGIAVIDLLQFTSTNIGNQTEEAIRLMLEHDVHFVMTFINLWMIPPILAHVHVSQLKERAFDVVWMGISSDMIRATFPFSKTLVNQVLRGRYDAFAEDNVTFDDMLMELQGSFVHRAPQPTGPVSAHFIQVTKDRSPPVQSPSLWIGDMFLAAAHGVRAMNADGYGCHLHSKNFNEKVGKRLYEYVIAQKFWGNTGWVEFDNDGNRKFPLHVVNFHSGHMVESIDPFYDPNGIHAAAFGPQPSIVGTFENSELGLDPESVLIWPNGISSDSPGSNPGHTESSCFDTTEDVLILLKHPKKLRKWIIVVFCLAGGVALIIIGMLYWSRLSLKNKVKEMEGVSKRIGALEFDLEAPLEKVVKVLNDLSKGITPPVSEVNNLKDMLAHGNIKSPNLEAQLRNSNQDIYSRDSIEYVLNHTLPRELSSCRSPHNNTPKHDLRQSFILLASSFNHENSRSVILDLRSTQSQLIGDFSPSWDFFGRALIIPSAEREAELRSKIGQSLTLETIELYQCTGGSPLQQIAMHVLDVTFNLVSTLNLNREKLFAFLQTIEHGYHTSNPYHNSTHAADVTARFAALMFQSKLDAILAPDELFAGILAAIIHDYQHPGSSNSFQVQAKTAVSMIYNNNSILENASVFTALELLSRPETSFTENICKTQMFKIRAMIVQSVLATDLSEHFAVLSDFKSKIPAGEFQRHKDLDMKQRGLLLNMGVKCADVGHVAINLPDHLIWVRSLQAEFYLQGDCEREMGIPVSTLMDRKKPRNGPAHGEQQLGFFDFICIPMYEAWVERFPACSILMNHLVENRKYWEEDARLSNNSNIREVSIEIQEERNSNVKPV